MKKLKFTPRNVSGVQMYFDKEYNKYSIIEDTSEDKYYIRIFDGSDWVYPTWALSGFNTLQDAIDWLNRQDWENADCDNISQLPPSSKSDETDDFQTVMNMFGFTPISDIKYSMVLDDDYYTAIDVVKNCDGDLVTTIYHNGQADTHHLLPRPTDNIPRFIHLMENLLSSFNYTLFSDVLISSSINRKQAVTAAINTKNLASNLVRVKSSNVWGYNINVKDHKSKFGDVLVQFKGRDGGPGDVYIYYDVPVLTYRRWHSAPSKGHYFWKYIRNFFKYSKLTGDKRGKLHNAVN